MRGYSSIVVALGLLGFAGWAYLNGGFSAAVMGALAGAGFFLFRGYQNIGFSPVEDLTTPIEFVTNPTDTIVDCAAGELGEFFNQDEPKPDDERKFDPDAIIAHYLENRAAAAPQPAMPSAAPSGFGRKGL